VVFTFFAGYVRRLRIGCRPWRAHKINYVKCGNKFGTATAAAPYIIDFMQHTRQKMRQPLALSDGGIGQDTNHSAGCQANSCFVFI
jgi:hypothetical protein